MFLLPPPGPHSICINLYGLSLITSRLIVVARYKDAGVYRGNHEPGPLEIHGMKLLDAGAQAVEAKIRAM